jgi:hypothetical protein
MCLHSPGDGGEGCHGREQVHGPQRLARGTPSGHSNQGRTLGKHDQLVQDVLPGGRKRSGVKVSSVPGVCALWQCTGPLASVAGRLPGHFLHTRIIDVLQCPEGVGEGHSAGSINNEIPHRGGALRLGDVARRTSGGLQPGDEHRELRCHIRVLLLCT